MALLGDFDTTTRTHAQNTGKTLINKPEFYLGLLTVREFQDAFPTWETQFIWGRQRGINPDIVTQIVEDLTQPGRETVRLLNLNITLGTVNHRDAKIMDGQHRLHALMSSTENVEFTLTIANFETDNARFLEFVKINSNTPLPEFYKSITDYDSFCQNAATQITKKMTHAFPHLFTDRPRTYYLHKPTLIEQLYVVLQQHHIPMAPDEIERFGQLLLETLTDPIVFPNAVIKYPIQPLETTRCKSQQKTGVPNVQCSNPSKTAYGGFCGIHKAGKHPFNGVHLRNQRHQELTPYETYFILHPTWINQAVENVTLRICFEHST
jgi:hypothetical protein